MFSYRVSFKLHSLAEQQRRFRRPQQQQLGGGEALRVVRSATLVSRHWELSSAWRDGEPEVVDGEGAVGFAPTLIAKDADDDVEGENVDDGDDDDLSSFTYCSRVEAPPHYVGSEPPVDQLHPPGQRLGSFGGHFLFRAEFDDGTAGDVEVPVEPFELVVPSVIF